VKLVWEGGDCVRQLGLEPDSSDLGLWLRHEFSNRLEDDPKLAVVFLFQFIESSSECFIGANHLPQVDERSHDGDVHLNRPFAMEYAREHGVRNHTGQRLQIIVFVAPNT
jgi:hypothetical protein